MVNFNPSIKGPNYDQQIIVLDTEDELVVEFTHFLLGSKHC